MTYKSVALNSFTPVSTPTIVNNVVIDGHVDGRPVVLRKMRGGMLMPAIGTVLPLSMGTGIVTGYRDEMLVVDVVDFNDDFEFETKDPENPDILDAEEYVAMLNQCYRSSIESQRADFIRINKSEVTERLSEKNMERMLACLPMPEPTEIVVGFRGKFLQPTDHIVVQEVVAERESPSERRARIKAERALAKRLANAMLEDADAPDDVQADIDAEFAELDMDF